MVCLSFCCLDEELLFAWFEMESKKTLIEKRNTDGPRAYISLNSGSWYFFPLFRRGTSFRVVREGVEEEAWPCSARGGGAVCQLVEGGQR